MPYRTNQTKVPALPKHSLRDRALCFFGIHHWELRSLENLGLFCTCCQKQHKVDLGDPGKEGFGWEILTLWEVRDNAGGKLWDEEERTAFILENAPYSIEAYELVASCAIGSDHP